jgi:hypothetical protein
VKILGGGIVQRAECGEGKSTCLLEPTSETLSGSWLLIYAAEKLSFAKLNFVFWGRQVGGYTAG